ncbi:MAG: hypothetical protein ACOCZT_00150 [Halanaerobiales bacterium]
MLKNCVDLFFLITVLFILKNSTVCAEDNEGRCVPPRVLISDYDTANNLVELAINEIIELNREDVDFLNSFDLNNQSQELIRNEYELRVEANQQDTDIAFIKMILIDPKKREAYKVKVEESMEGWDIVDLENHLSQRQHKR